MHIKRTMLSAVAAIALSGALAFGANVPLIVGPVPAADVQSFLNQLITSFNGATGKISASTLTAGLPGTTAEVTLQSYTVAPNQLAAGGDSLRVTCWGTFAGGAATKTVRLYFGAAVTTASAAAVSAGGWQLTQVVTRKSATAQGYTGQGIANATVAPGVGVDAAEALTAAVLVKCTGQSSVSELNNVTANGMVVEALK